MTPEGTEYLKANNVRLEQLFERLDEAGKGFERGRSPEIMKAFMRFAGRRGISCFPGERNSGANPQDLGSDSRRGQSDRRTLSPGRAFHIGCSVKTNGPAWPLNHPRAWSP